MKVTSTGLLSSVFSIAIMFLIGSFMFITMAVMGEYVLTAYENYSKKQSADIMFEARIHRFDSKEFITNPNGETRFCTAITTGKGRPVVRERNHQGKPVPVGEFCSTMMSHENLNNWKRHSRHTGPNIVETIFWAAGFFVVFMAAGFLVTSIPANLLGIMFPALLPYTKIMAWTMALPVLLFWAMMTEAALTPVPSHWHDSNGYLVNTQRVYVSRDLKLYTAPEQLFDWTKSDTMSKLREKF